MSEINIDEFIKAEKKTNYKELFEKYKASMITAIYYSLGLFVGAYIYKTNQSDIINKAIRIDDNTLLQLMLTNVLIYFIIFLVVMFLGFCLIGNHIINIVPAIIGIITGAKIAFYFINYNVKGIGYAMVIIIPYSALFISILSLLIETSSSLSKTLLDSAKNQDRIFMAKPYLKRYLILGLCVIAAAIINSIMTYLMMNIVTI